MARGEGFGELQVRSVAAQILRQRAVAVETVVPRGRFGGTTEGSHRPPSRLAGAQSGEAGNLVFEHIIERLELRPGRAARRW